MNDVKKAINDSAAMRWTVLVMVSVLMFGTYWFQDFFSPLQPMMRDTWGFTNSQFGSLIASTTFLNMFGGIIVGGMVLDKFGPKACIFIFGGIAGLGALLSALGGAGMFGDDPASRLMIMIPGRMAFGIGLEVTCVLVSKTVVKWFKGHELALAMGVNVGFGRLGSMGAIWFSQDIAAAFTPEGGIVMPGPAVSFAAVLIGIGLVVFIAHLMFDAKLDADRRQIAADAGDEVSDEDQFKISDLFLLLKNPSFLFVAFLCVTFYSAVFPFIQYAPDLLVNKFGFTSTLPETSGFMETAKAWLTNGPKIAGLIPLFTLIFTPIFGAMIDKKGKAASIMMLGSALIIFAHLSLSVFNSVVLGYAGLAALGCAFALVPSAMWPSVAKIVPESRLGTAYATMFTIQNWGLGAFFFGIGWVLDLVNPKIATAKAAADTAIKLAEAGNDQAAIDAATVLGDNAGKMVYDYTIPILMLVALGVISIYLAFMLKRADKKQGYGLELPSGQTPD